MTYTYQDTNSFQWGFNCAPQTLEIADLAMVQSKFEIKFQTQMAIEHMKHHCYCCVIQQLLW